MELDRRSFLIFAAGAGAALQFAPDWVGFRDPKMGFGSVVGAIDTGVGDFYIATDDGKLYVKAEDGKWKVATDIS